MSGYNKAARAMIRYAKRTCDTCEYGEWSALWKRVTTDEKNQQRLITWFRKRRCEHCGLYDTETEQLSFWKGTTGEWKPSNEYSKRTPFQEEVSR